MSWVGSTMMGELVRLRPDRPTARRSGSTRRRDLLQRAPLAPGGRLGEHGAGPRPTRYVLTVERWIGNVRRNRARINELSPGFARVLQTYMTIGKLSFERRAVLEYMIVAVKPQLAGGSVPR